jgi:hypothetical protein
MDMMCVLSTPQSLPIERMVQVVSSKFKTEINPQLDVLVSENSSESLSTVVIFAIKNESVRSGTTTIAETE